MTKLLLQGFCTLFFLLAIQLSLGAQDLAKKKIKASFKEKPLELALLTLKLDYRLEFQFDKNEVADVKVSAFIPNLRLPEAMQLLLAETDLTFSLLPPRTIEIFPKGRADTQENVPAALPQNVTAKQFDLIVAGQVRDALTGESLPFSTVSVSGTTNATTTNVDGWFTLFDVPSDTTVLEVSYIGYQTTTFRLLPDMSFDQLVIKMQTGSQVLEEVTVLANRKEQMIQASAGISQVAINPAQIKAVPSLGEKDIFRSLQLLPGVSGSNESSSGLYVRGGTPDQNLVLFDGFTVYHVDHLFGFFSAFNSNAIKDVQLYKGGFEAKYGGRLSSVVDITGKDGNAETLNVGAGLSAVAANAFAEVPFAKGKGTIILTGRHSFQSNFYKDLLEFSDGDDETGTEENTEEEETNGPFRGGRGFNTTEPNSWFYDFNGKATYRMGKNVFSLSLYGGKDKLDNSRFTDRSRLGGGFSPFGGGGTEEDFNFSIDIVDKSDWGNTGGSLKWSRRWSDKLYSNALISRSNYFSFRDRGNSTLIERDTIRTEINTQTVEDNDLVDYSLRWDWEWQPNPAHKIGFGIFGSALDIKYDFIQDDTTTVLARDDQGIIAGAYLQSKSTLSDKLLLVPGVRFSYFDQTGEPYIEPRLQLQYLPSTHLKVKAATGRFYQFANRILREDVSQGSRDFWILSDAENVPVGASTHFILGAAYETDDWLFDVEGYYKSLDNITEYSTRFLITGFGPNSSLGFEENFYNGQGAARGIEFLLQKKKGSLTGWISYTLGRVEHEFDVFGDDPFPASHDVTNELKIVGTYRVGHWSFGGTFVYATGRPYTAPIGAYSVELLDGTYNDFFAISDKNAFRLPNYHRLDLSVNLDLPNFLNGNASTGLSLFNFYGRKNVWYKEYDVVDGSIIETDVNLLGFTPSLYFNWSLK